MHHHDEVASDQTTPAGLLATGASPTAASAVDVSAALIQRRPGVDQMQLHKLLYGVQAASLAWFGEPAFAERIEAWQYGPAVRRVAGLYMDFDTEPILEPLQGSPDRLTDRLLWVIDRVLAEFGHLSGPALARLVKVDSGVEAGLR